MSIKPKLTEKYAVVYISPPGETFNQNKAVELSHFEDMVNVL